MDKMGHFIYKFSLHFLIYWFFVRWIQTDHLYHITIPSFFIITTNNKTSIFFKAKSHIFFKKHFHSMHHEKKIKINKF
ncbi:hypothetical protein RhiirA1_273657 [Rhizophagus irregularis]|uniref:Uncharacterized protein n=1 Tax=Rhizophagus irregularis TaxID=588596 RepID=A0A2N0REE4_9GLOM|nr:hypothetical protein RhiirA1_273657 [Rhizophagus irregularis]GET52359.1 hypothetical protein RIR_jg16631.t1 [Rhizophagus irregularis DAOM 181602=DAOM 197198]